MTAPTSPKPRTPADHRDADLRTALTKLADEAPTEMPSGLDDWEKGRWTAQRDLGITIRALLAAHPARNVAAEALCLADTSWEHHDRTDDFPCSSCVSDTRREDELVETVARALSRSEHPGVQAYMDARAVMAVLAAPPVVDETECGRCEQVRPISWTDDDEVTYCEECVNAIMTDLHADIARVPVVDEAALRDLILQVDEEGRWENIPVAEATALAAEIAARLRGATR